MDDKELIKSILEKNKDKDFVQRILYPKQYPNIKNKDGSFSTHRMAWGQLDDGYYVWPTISHKNGRLTQHKPDEALKRALKTGDFIKFNNPRSADWFSQQYKTIWKKQ